ncbi:ABC transporter permease [Aneurinibacillus thermoaerophilus]|uniref:ABC transporter permease n=1 Tax=Aneurinibacillus thermoaerophilus TaxID=143495 RepID=A0A1G8F1G8_ANETH|nr:ABC transporter permease [Aneurinibacillus thermoaerophilus]MED0676797.1 ABC transporter permease [Aneurinibacillus thermoaerophilus]MED0680631.1 ABC transporter permease [Aneurinibacillus thermoaerophilus]MED0738900.1 ABC transporter permease [Aneurinibacillus thermoaerophilus]MED0757863.1 ABC transporter permease [Aneurinibacillus thermoaerophilus]MED0762138.1 ABC transporter permease [Aneurinibacillus thermoaerophilus]
MINLLYTELLKLKRSKMFLISVLGAAVAPFMVVVASYIYMKTEDSHQIITFPELFSETNLYTVLLIGVPLYGVVSAYLFNREYLEDTLKNLLTIPVSRISLIMSKLIILFMWIMFLTFVAWGLTLFLGVLGQFQGLSPLLIVKSLGNFMTGGLLLFILSTPIVLVAVVMKNYVPTIIFTIVITLINVMSGNSEHRGLFPWAAAGDIANDTLQPTYPAEVSYIAIFATSIIGLIATIVYFKKVDIH